MSYTKIATIRNTVARANDAGLGITEYQLRNWVRNGTIPAIHCGKRCYINWDALIGFIDSYGAVNAEEA